MYPELLNLYGDQGNITAITRRCQWRDIDFEIYPMGINDHVNFTDIDLVFLGGGSDREQNLIASDLIKRQKSLMDAIEDNLTLLAICGGYQLLGKYYRTLEGKIIPGLELLDLYTIAGQNRLIGDVAIEVELGGKKHKVTGFENHSGRTYLGNIKPLGKVLSGHGNNGEDYLEGVLYKNVVGTYLHGPLLPKNPFLTDYLITRALEKRYPQVKLKPLDDSLEKMAGEVILNRLLG